ncbi:MAG TPA: sugar ABC transporter permease [bacterium]|nr:sugar ABC transporter permease [bacterium]
MIGGRFGAVAHVAGTRRRRRHVDRDDLAGYAFIAPWLLGFFAFTVIPIGASLVLAFTNYNILSPSRWTGLENFDRMFTQDPHFWISVKQTFYFVFTSVPLRLAFALALAMALNVHRRGVGVYRALYYLPSIVGANVAVAEMWRQVFGTDGLVNAALGSLGFPSKITWLGSPATAIWTVVALAVWEFGSPMLIFLAGLRQIPAELYEAAAIDGVGPVSKFVRITLPMLSPIIFFNLVLQLIFGFTVFTSAFILSGGTGAPLDTLLFYPLYLYQKGFRDLEMGYAAGMAWVLLVVVAALTALAFKSSRYWVFYAHEEG